jgi:hypothetical protein
MLPTGNFLMLFTESITGFEFTASIQISKIYRQSIHLVIGRSRKISLEMKFACITGLLPGNHLLSKI